MIPSRKSPAFNFVLRRWLARTLRRRFHNVYVIGGEHLRALDPARPVVGCVNHTNWWDGFVLYVLSHRRLPHDIYLAMEEANLRRYGFFAWMGVFGVDLASRRAVLPGVRYAARLLAPGRLVWIFVQGRLCPPSVSIAARPGAGFLARQSGAALLPIALRYEWLIESRPSVFACVGAPLPPDTSAAALADALNALFKSVDARLDPPDLSGCEPLFPPSRSVHTGWDAFRARFWPRRAGVDKPRP